LQLVALLEPANVPQATELQDHKVHIWFLKGSRNLFYGFGWNKIGEPGLSETVLSRFLFNNKALIC
jgi:hypothetical protein